MHVCDMDKIDRQMTTSRDKKAENLKKLVRMSLFRLQMLKLLFSHIVLGVNTVNEITDKMQVM